MEGMEFFLCQEVVASTSDFQISFLGGKILFCRDPAAMEVSGWSENVRVSLSFRMRMRKVLL